MISEAEAIEIARRAIVGKVSLQEDAPIRVQRRRSRYTITFIHINAPGVRGPDYDARVTIDARTGEVYEILGAP